MSTKVALFAFPAKVKDDAILKELSMTVDTMSGDVEMGNPFAVVKTYGNVKFVHVVATEMQPNRAAARGTAMDMFSYASFPSAFLGYDDQNGIYLFQFYDPPNKTFLLLMSDGCRLGGNVDDLKTDYPQKGFSNEELDRLHQIDEAALTPAQYRAIAEYESAIDIGLRDRFGWSGGRDYLKICYEKKGVPLSGKKRTATVLKDVGGLFAFWPDDRDFRSAGLPQRTY
jgi:hypothetical protein